MCPNLFDSVQATTATPLSKYVLNYGYCTAAESPTERDTSEEPKQILTRCREAESIAIGSLTSPAKSCESVGERNQISNLVSQ
jgi:hypothetical protein